MRSSHFKRFRSSLESHPLLLTRYTKNRQNQDLVYPFLAEEVVNFLRNKNRDLLDQNYLKEQSEVLKKNSPYSTLDRELRIRRDRGKRKEDASVRSTKQILNDHANL